MKFAHKRTLFIPFTQQIFYCLQILKEQNRQYVMQSREISLKPNTHVTFPVFCFCFFLILLKSSFGVVHFAENPIWIGTVVLFISYDQLKDSQNNRKQKKLIPFLAISPGLYLTINAPDFRLIATHIVNMKTMNDFQAERTANIFV